MKTVPKKEQWIGLLSGAEFNYNYPDKTEATLDDLASALSNICRFSGHLPVFYSVAQHLVNCSRLVPLELQFDALMHDTAEAFTNDLPTPLKWSMPEFKELETRIESAMAKKFGFRFPYDPLVKQADTEMLILEKLYVKKDDRPWPNYEGIEVAHLVPLVDLKPWSPKKAKKKFLSRFDELQKKLGKNVISLAA